MAGGSDEKGPEEKKRLGTARTWKKAVAARANGQRGGRPTRWSREVVEVAAACLREHAQRLSGPLQEELVQFAHAVETRNLQMRDRRRPKAPSKISVVMQLRVTGRSRISERRVEEQIVEQVLRDFEVRRQDGWDYAVVLPVMPDLELHELLSVRIPAAIDRMAAMRNCTVDYVVRSMDDPARTWTRVAPEAAVVHQRAELEMALTCTQGKKVVDEVVRTVGRRYPVQERDVKAGRCRVAMWYTTAEDLERVVREIVGEMSVVARAHRRVLGYELRLVGQPERYWDGVLS